MGLTAAGASLFEENDAICLGVEEPAVIGNETRAWSTVQKHHRLPVGCATLFVIKLVDSGHPNVAAVVRLKLVVKSSPCWHVAADYRLRACRSANRSCRRALHKSQLTSIAASPPDVRRGLATPSA